MFQKSLKGLGIVCVWLGVHLFVSCSQEVFARPEYSAREKLNCVSCHAYPWGGGPRNVFGKTYGSHGHMPSKLSASDLYYGDLRMTDEHRTYTRIQTNMTMNKLDYLALDRNELSDAYLRHGFGIEIYPSSNLILNVRVERVGGMRPETASSDVLAAQNDIFAMFRMWL